jgi:hypothetical protein
VKRKESLQDHTDEQMGLIIDALDEATRKIEQC